MADDKVRGCKIDNQRSVFAMVHGVHQVEVQEEGVLTGNLIDLDWEPETIEDLAPLPRRKRRGEKEEAHRDEDDPKVRRVEPPGTPPTTVDKRESEGALPLTPLLVGPPSYPREEEATKVRTPHVSAETPALEATEARASSCETGTALPPGVSQEEVEVGSPEEA
ncbi:hypothetical protein EAI_00488 [Harpegnathos saltator]|uniref:Uncharacterized protein n=1 Tax=Harpegnathos saltator TaxID=610380 RepID=E2C8B9_HARSA|nr:hypothetical protein EAI_00488 [Harpegnathos saltator]